MEPIWATFSFSPLNGSFCCLPWHLQRPLKCRPGFLSGAHTLKIVLTEATEWRMHTEDSISLGCWVLSQWKLSYVGWINLHCDWAVNGKPFTCNRTSLPRTKPTAVDQCCDSASTRASWSWQRLTSLAGAVWEQSVSMAFGSLEIFFWSFTEDDSETVANKVCVFREVSQKSVFTNRHGCGSVL